MRFLSIFLLAILPVFPATSGAEQYRWPLSFEPNLGQVDANFSYVARSRSMTMLFNGGGALVSGKGFEFRLDFPGADRHAAANGVKPREGVSNYLTGNVQSKWVRGVPHFGGVSFREVYPGIDAVYYGSEGTMEYDFNVSPGADPSKIRMRLSGAKSWSLGPSGDLLIDAGGTTMRMKRPVAYQEKDGVRTPVSVAYSVSGDRAYFKLGKYDHRRELVIDPEIDYLSYYNGAGTDYVIQMTSDAQHLYMVSQFTTPQFGPPTPAPKRLNKGKGGIAIMTFITGAPQFVGSQTFIGGSSADGCSAILPGPIPDTVWIAGLTFSNDFPVTDGSKANGGADGYVALVGPVFGQIQFATYLGGSATDRINAMTAWNGGVIVVGDTQSANFPIKGTPISSKLQGVEDAFLAYYKPSSTLNYELAYSSFLGGTNAEEAFGISASGNTIIVAGNTNSTDFPTTANAVSKTNHGGIDIFASAFNFDGQSATMISSTYLGGSSDDSMRVMQGTNSSPGVVIGGYTNSSDFPVTQGIIDPNYGGGKDAFLMRLDVVNQVMVWSTYLGGSGSDDLYAIEVDQQDGVWAAGSTSSAIFPGVATNTPPPDLRTWVEKLDPTGSSFASASAIAGLHFYVIPYTIKLDAGGNLWGGGVTAEPVLQISNNALMPYSSPDTSPFTGTTDGFYFFTRDAAQGSISCIYDLTTPGDLTEEAQDITLNLITTRLSQVDNTCPWRVVNGGTFVTVNGPVTGKGAATITVHVPKNDTKATRQAALYVGPRLALIRQSSLESVPAIFDGGVVGAALSVPSLRRLAYNGLFTVFGTDFAPTGTALGAQLVDGALSTVLGGVCVTFNDVRVPLINVFPGQITAVAPLQVLAGDADSSAEIRVLNQCDTPNPVTSNAEVVPYGNQAPEFLYFKTTPNDGSPVAAVDAITGAPIGPTDLIPGHTSPAKPGSIVTIYGVGFGEVTPAVFQGQPALVASKVSAPVKVFLNGKQMDDADVQYVGVTVGSVGLYQVNLQIPSDTPSGRLPLKIQLGTEESPAGGYLTIGK